MGRLGGIASLLPVEGQEGFLQVGFHAAKVHQPVPGDLFDQAVQGVLGGAAAQSRPVEGDVTHPGDGGEPGAVHRSGEPDRDMVQGLGPELGEPFDRD